jgi:hypothetical protein
MECYYLRIYDRWLFGATEYVTSHSETLVLVTILFVFLPRSCHRWSTYGPRLGYYVWYSFRRLRGRWCPI